MDSSVLSIFAVVVVVEVVVNLSAYSPRCRCYFVFSTDQLIIFCVKQALRGGIFTINPHVGFQKKCEFYKQDRWF